MHVVAFNKNIYAQLSVKESELQIAGLRALNEKHERERTLTPQLKNNIVTAVMHLEECIARVNESTEIDQGQCNSLIDESELSHLVF